GDGRLQSGTAAVKVGNFDILGQSNYRESNDYEDGSGNVIEDTGDRTKSNMVNARWRPAPGHQITGTVIDLTSDFVERPATVPATLRNTTVENSQYTLGYTYSRPDTPLLDFSARIYRNDTRLDQSNVTNPLAFRNFDLKTEGFDINNTSRFGTGAFKVALTYGVDGVYDTVDTFDTAGYGSALTPGGKRSLEGAFVQS